MRDMAEPVIPIVDWHRLSTVPAVPAQSSAPQGVLLDALGRPLRDLRISVTDRCNFRCSYCMPKEKFDHYHQFLPHGDLLTFEEISRLAQIFIAHGVQKIRLTGGEPLLRKHLENLVHQLAKLRTPQGDALDLTLTTNGSVLARKAQTLKDAGLQRITVSLDALDDTVFQCMNDVGFPVAEVLKGIEQAQKVGLAPIKVNMVVKRGVNVDQILPMAKHFRHSGVTLRFIEYMDVGASNGWRMDDVVPSAEMLGILQEHFSLSPLQASAAGETAERWAYADGAGEVGFISSVSHAFCADCNRARLSTEGKLYMCLFANSGHDLRSLLRSELTDAQISSALAPLWQQRQDRYSELRASGAAQNAQGFGQRIEMHYIGG